MRFLRLAIFPASLLAAVACQHTVPQGAQPPRAAVDPVRLEKHGHVRTDEYYWLRERENPAVRAYLEAENAYTEAMTAHTAALREQLFEEIKGRIQQTDESVPYEKNGYFYSTRFEAGQEYPLYCRRAGSLEAPEELMLDVNELAEGHEFCSARTVGVSPDNTTLAFAVDTVGRRFYTLRFKDLRSGTLLADAIADVTGNAVWAGDSRTVFYSKQDPLTLRSHRIFRHILGADPASDELVYEEADDTFGVRVSRTQSERYLLIRSSQTLSSEVRYLAADDPGGDWRVFQPRERGLEYRVDHLGERFYVRTNLEAPNFRLVAAAPGETGKAGWSDVVPHRADVFLSSFALFRDHLVVQERREGLTRLRIRAWDGGAEHELDFGEPAYSASVSANPEPDTPWMRFRYTSMTTPNSTFDYHMETREKILRKCDVVLGGFDRESYATERLWATARDGTRVPISIVYRKEFARDGSHALLLYGYGSYGSSMSARFDAARLSLLDRGFAYAIAHVRGGQELGRHWYEDGKLLRKKNTFTDFIDCASFLIAEGYTSAERLFAMGGSAGGLLVGAVANMAPERFAGIVAQVPWVDVVTTMLDDSIPLTTSEYDEWGNPSDREYHDYMLSYSPYDQVAAQAYPAMLVTAGFHDSQVQYWEPAKWVARLRARKTDENILLLRTDMGAGHGGPSGRTRRYRETAFVYAFLLDIVGYTE